MRRTSTIGCLTALVGAAVFGACSGGGTTPVSVGPGNTGGTSGAGGSGSSSATSGQASGGQGSGATATGAPGSGAGAGSTMGSGSVAVLSGATSGGAATGSASAGASSGGAGTSASGMPGGDGGAMSGPSLGCGVAPTDPVQQAVQHSMMVTVAPAYQPAYVPRIYFTTLPENYNPSTPYPVIFYGQGCGQTGSEGGPFTTGHFLTDVLYVQLIPATVTGATVVPSDGSPGCFQAGKQGTTDSPDGPYFDQVLAEIAPKYCIDKGKLYVAGSSSGAWLTNYLVCTRGNVIRGGAADSGGLQHDHPTCTGGAYMMEMPGDSASVMVGGFDIGVAPARDTFIAANGSSMTPTTMTFGAAGCQLYSGGTAPVAYCNVGGAHQSGIPFIAAAAWAFWNP
jgi:hypothetical protein